MPRVFFVSPFCFILGEGTILFVNVHTVVHDFTYVNMYSGEITSFVSTPGDPAHKAVEVLTSVNRFLLVRRTPQDSISFGEDSSPFLLGCPLLVFGQVTIVLQRFNLISRQSIEAFLASPKNGYVVI